MHSCACTDLTGPLAGLLVERLGSCQNGLIDRLVGGHHQQFWLIVILTISKIILLIYLSLHYCLLILGLGGGARGLCVVVVGEDGGRGGGIEEKESQGQQERKQKHGRRSHLVQYERHWMEEQRTGRKRSKEKGGVTAHASKEGGRRTRSWFGQVAHG